MLLLLIIGTIIISLFVGNPFKKRKNYKENYNKKKTQRRFKNNLK